jgi:transmembrane protein TMEM260 (protein O-mannosyltransferase)
VNLWSGAHGEKIFQRLDWLSFWLTTGLALTLYVLTLPPEVTLAWSGILATSAKYGGISAPPGFPLWTLYGWLFIKLIPFSNVAWRLAFSSAVAGALACGVVSLMVSRGAATIFEASEEFRAIAGKEKSQLRLVCSVVSGMGFAAHESFWGEAVMVDDSALGCLLFAVVLCFLMCWSYHPEQNGLLFAAALVYGLSLSVNLLYWVVAPALPLIVMFRRPAVGRDLFFGLTGILALVLVAEHFDRLPDLVKLPLQFSGLKTAYGVVGSATCCLCLAMTAYTRRLMTNYPLLGGIGALLALGLAPYLSLPFISMGNPPTNWGYPRTVEGFIHVLSRGQFEHLAPTADFSTYLRQILQYAQMTTENLGWFYSAAAVVPFCFIHRVRSPERGWLLGLLFTFLCLSLFTLAVMNPPADRQASAVMAEYFLASHLILVLWAGYGLILVGGATRRQKRLVQTELPLAGEQAI